MAIYQSTNILSLQLRRAYGPTGWYLSLFVFSQKVVEVVVAWTWEVGAFHHFVVAGVGVAST
jgi:hypothetical protein